jgi:hypothetical protein
VDSVIAAAIQHRALEEFHARRDGGEGIGFGAKAGGKQLHATLE